MPRKLMNSRECMAWQPPAGWNDLSYEERFAHLKRLGLSFPLRTSDWDDMDYLQQVRYSHWLGQIMHDTPEKRACKRREERREVLGWWRLLVWWCLCLAGAMALIWTDVVFGASITTAERVGLTVFTVAGYAVAIGVPMYITAPTKSTR
ncbi:hypothetical protein [Streptomyces sp. NPDC026673]|uniref:hypothetical protein n=1 Tax=Streptomyces sp. NPDC026673 TaxID=3155724 RepID=UPI0034091A31